MQTAFESVVESAFESVPSTTRAPAAVTTLIFDVDDTMYDVGCGFTAHRNGGAVAAFMVAHLKFES